MTESTKDIRHINENNQEYIAEGNRMTEEIRLTTEVLNCDYFNRNRGFNCYKEYNCTDKECYDCYYRQLKRLRQENEELKEANQSLSMLGTDLVSANETVRKEFFRADKNKDMWREKAEEYRFALEEIRTYLNTLSSIDSDFTNTETYLRIQDKINEVLK